MTSPSNIVSVAPSMRRNTVVRFLVLPWHAAVTVLRAVVVVELVEIVVAVL